MADAKTIAHCANQMSALGEPSRIRMIELLIGGKKNVSEIAKALKIPIVNASHHLSVLRAARLVEDTKEGRFVIYTLNPDVFKVSKGKATVDFGWCKIYVG